MSNQYNAWPELPYAEFKPTTHLLHMMMQMIGKLKLLTPFEPHWANVALWMSGRGLTTGEIPFADGTFTIDVDLIDHQIICATSWGQFTTFKIKPTSVAEFYQTFFAALKQIGVDVKINSMPQEIENPIPFEKDQEQRPYEANLVNAWWRILVSSNRVMQKYHALFTGITPPIGLMWGTLDLRDARYKGIKVPTTGINAGYIRRNAMDDAQVEAGWWCGNDMHPRPAYFSFTYPQPEGIEKVRVLPAKAYWDATLGEFLLEYDDVRTAKDPEKELLSFFQSTYAAGAEFAEWNPEWISSGEPV